VLVEADPAGGVLAVRYRLGAEPGLVGLVAAARAGAVSEAAEVLAHAQRVPGGLPVVAAPVGAELVHSALRAGGEALGRRLGDAGALDVVIDAGRLGPESPATALIHHADAVLMVAWPVAEQLMPGVIRLRSLSTRCRRVGWVLIGDQPHSAGEVEATFGFDVAGVVADDPRGAAGVEGAGSQRAVARSALARSAAALADSLYGGWLGSNAERAPAAGSADNAGGGR
jgi:hypothetical protein